MFQLLLVFYGKLYIYIMSSLCGLQIEFKVMVNSDYPPGN